MRRLGDAQELIGALEDVHPDELTEQDMKEIRESLPTEPTLARIVELSMPFPWSEVFLYVEDDPPYWRAKADPAPQSEAEARTRERMAEAAQRARGVEGTVERDGRVIPASAAVTADALADRSYPGKAAAGGRKALRRLREVLRV